MLRHSVGGVGHYSIDNVQEKNTVNPYCPEVQNFGEIKLDFSTWGLHQVPKLFERHIKL